MGIFEFWIHYQKDQLATNYSKERTARGDVSEKVNQAMRPAMYETHIEQWKIDLNQRRKQQIEGDNKD